MIEGNVPNWDSPQDGTTLSDTLHPAGCACVPCAQIRQLSGEGK